MAGQSAQISPSSNRTDQEDDDVLIDEQEAIYEELNNDVGQQNRGNNQTSLFMEESQSVESNSESMRRSEATTVSSYDGLGPEDDPDLDQQDTDFMSNDDYDDQDLTEDYIYDESQSTNLVDQTNDDTYTYNDTNNSRVATVNTSEFASSNLGNFLYKLLIMLRKEVKVYILTSFWSIFSLWSIDCLFIGL
jgi:hypothetical protein